MILNRPITQSFMKMDLVVGLSRYETEIENNTCLKSLKNSKKVVALAVLGVIAGIQMPMKLIKMTNKDVEIDLLPTESQGIQ